jgi:hypothetical protein
MRFLSTRLHGAADYVMSIVLLAWPTATGVDAHSPFGWAVAAVGVCIFLFSMFTDYEYGVLRILPIRLHLALDAIAGIVLVAIGILAGLRTWMWLVVSIFGAMELLAVLLTRPQASDDVAGLSPTILTHTSDATVAMPAPHGNHDRHGRPTVPAAPNGKVTSEQLRSFIDSGSYGDKVAVVDPAAAPLGADDEAAQLHDAAGLARARAAPNQQS